MPDWPWRNDPFHPDAPLTLGWHAIAWAEGSLGDFHHDDFYGLVQPNGPKAGQRFVFTQGQADFLLWWYAVDRETERWVYDHGVLRQAKGTGKSPFAAVWCLIEFCAPCRLADGDMRFDPSKPGGVRGKPVDLPLVQIAATAESQTKNTMRMVRAFAQKGSPVTRHYNLDVGKTVYYKQPEGTLEVITSSPTAAEGAEATAVVMDETEHWKPSNQGPDLAATLDDNLSKSGSRSIETANAWVPDADTVAENSWDAWVAQEEGRMAEEADHILYHSRLAPPGTRMDDVDSLTAALRWVYGDCPWKRGADGEIDVTPMLRRILSPRSTLSDSKRKYLNWPAASDDTWILPEQWSAMADYERKLEPGERVVLFFDGSKSSDTTAIVGCCLSDGHIFVPQTIDGRPTIWQPNPNVTDDVVPVFDVDNAVDFIFTTSGLKVVAFFGDVQEWESFVKVEWPKRHGRGLKLWAQKTGKDPQVIAWDMRSRSMEFTRAAELAMGEVQDATFTHDGNAILARHVANLRRSPNRHGMSVSKESPSSPKKIDAAVCMIGARMLYHMAVAAKLNRPPRKSALVALG